MSTNYNSSCSSIIKTKKGNYFILTARLIINPLIFSMIILEVNIRDSRSVG